LQHSSWLGVSLVRSRAKTMTMMKMILRQQMVLQQLLQTRLQMQARKLSATQHSSASSRVLQRRQSLSPRSRTLLLQQQLLYHLQPSMLQQTRMAHSMQMPTQHLACSSCRRKALCKLATSAAQRSSRRRSCQMRCSSLHLPVQTPLRQVVRTLWLLPLLLQLL
jgi:hypothetical protein